MRLAKYIFPAWLLIAMFAGATFAPPTAHAQDTDDVEAELERAEREIERATRSLENIGERGEGRNNVVVHFGSDSNLPAGETAEAVVAIMGSATASGLVHEALVAIGGNATLTDTGSVGEGVVALFGNVYVDGQVGGDGVVAFMGDVKLGPNARVAGEVVSVGGAIERDPASKTAGGIQEIGIGEKLGLTWLRPWFEKCFLYGRPLAFGADLAWAWWVAFGFLALYVMLALMFDEGIKRCVTTVEEKPLQTLVASLLTMLMSPVVLIILAVTIIGAILVPFVALALFCAALFGKAVILAALGRRLTRFTGIAPMSHIAFATFIGGLLALALYVVPVLGWIAYNVLGVLGLGAVVYTMLLALRAHNAANAKPVMAAAAGPSDAPMDFTVASDGTTTLPPPSPGPQAAPSNMELTALPRAGFWIRMGALLIDALLIGVISNVIGSHDDFFLIVLASYGALMWKLKGTTIGGIICNLRVVRTDGRDIQWETSIVRALSCFLSLVPAGLGFLWMLFDNNRQTWHDKIAGTVVVRVPKSGSLV